MEQKSKAISKPEDFVIPEQDVHLIILAAARYCMGRHTYMSEFGADFVYRHIHEIPKTTQSILARDIRDEKELQDSLGNKVSEFDKHDLDKWVDLLPLLEA